MPDSTKRDVGLESALENGSTTGESIALIAHYSESNYGNHLVNVAAKRLLERSGASVDLIAFMPDRHFLVRQSLRRLPLKALRLVRDGQLVDRVRSRWRMAIESKRPSPSQAPAAATRAKRLAAFREFARLELQPTFVPAVDRARELRGYDRIAVGSDQIWNYDYDLGPWNFADFADPARTVCLAPSVGHERVPLEWLRTYRHFVSRFDEVGVRELDWTSDVHDERGRPTFTPLIDPTLMLDAQEWRNVASRSPQAPPGVLLYELGSLQAHQRDFVEEVARTHGLSQVTLSEREGGPPWETNAADFLAMISKASCVVTDSFHGAVFAFIFDRPLVIVRRHGFASSMNSRIDNLMRQLHLEDRVMERLTPASALSHDYSGAHESLRRLQASFQDYLVRHGVASTGATG